ncbi:flagellar hook-length control protein FliK [Oxalobacteraceae bacterium OM1]|nr:flagellar hook-length control protein FliK [Oxalobacteraceae bacterium OM1]
MLPRADLNNGARPLASIEAPTPVTAAGDARQEVYQRLAQVAIGKQLPAEVLSLLDDGTFLVKVADAPLRMALPSGTRVGERLPLVLVAREPRPTFLLTQGESSAPASLSQAGRLIDHILQIAQRDANSVAITPSQALLPAAPATMDAAKLAGTMQQHIETSGVFYESHVEQWAAGNRPLASLLQEPQAQGGPFVQHAPAPAKLPADMQRALAATLAQTAQGRGLGSASQSGSSQAALVSPAHLAALAQNAPELAADPQRLARMLHELQQQPGYSALAATTDADVLAELAGPSLPSVDVEVARLIHQQLHTLETRQVQWQGELWPGQRMEWAVSDETPGGADQARGAVEPVWSSRVRFHLPTLGEIEATLHLSGGDVRVDVRAADEATVVALRANGNLLAEALAAAGSPLQALLIARHGQG